MSLTNEVRDLMVEKVFALFESEGMDKKDARRVISRVWWKYTEILKAEKAKTNEEVSEEEVKEEVSSSSSDSGEKNEKD